MERIKENHALFELISESTNKVYQFKNSGENYILKHYRGNGKNLSPFWHMMKILFCHDFTCQIAGMDFLYQKLLNEYIEIAKPVYTDPVLKYHVYNKIDGENYSPDTFPENKNIMTQLGRFTGFIHQKKYENYGAIYNLNKSNFTNNLLKTITILAEKYDKNTDKIKTIFNETNKKNLSFDNFALIMPDISANQFVYSSDFETINGLVDLDAYIVGPVEMELTVIELCLPNEISASYFISGYEQFGKLPPLKNKRDILRLLIYLCDHEYNGDIESFMNKKKYWK